MDFEANLLSIDGSMQNACDRVDNKFNKEMLKKQK